MKVLTGVFLGSTALSIAVYPAASLVWQPISTLADVYGHSQQIANGVANGSIKGLNADQSNVNSDVKSMQSSNQSSVQTVDNMYSNLSRLTQ